MPAGRRPSGDEAAAFVLVAPSGVSRALHTELDERSGSCCFRAHVVLAEVRLRWVSGPIPGLLNVRAWPLLVFAMLLHMCMLLWRVQPLMPHALPVCARMLLLCQGPAASTHILFSPSRSYGASALLD